MNRYDSVFVKIREMNAAEYIEVDGCGLVESYGPIIVLTIEELEYVFAAGAMYGAKRYHPEWEERADFKTYLKSKGIEV